MTKIKGIIKLVIITMFLVTGCALKPALPNSGSSVPNKAETSTKVTKAVTKPETKPETKPVTKPETKPSGPKNAVSASEVKKMIANRSEEKIVFLTFDDGPSSNKTPEILDILKKNGVNATFFYYTKGSMERYSDIIKKTVQDGNAIAIHTNSHEYSELYPGREADANAIVADAKKALSKIKEVLGESWTTNVYRFPGGSFSWNNIDTAKKKLADIGLEYIDWNTMTGDSDGRNKDKSPSGLVSFLKESNENAGSKVHVVLMHDGGWVKSVTEGLQPIIDHYKNLGYKFSTLK